MILFSILLLFIQLQAVAQEPNATSTIESTSSEVSASDKNYDGCDAKLQEELARILKEDKYGIIPLQFHLTVLKTAKKIMTDYGTLKSKGQITQWPVFDRYIHDEMIRLKELNEQNPDVLKSIEKLYSDNPSDHIKDLAKNVDELKNHMLPDGQPKNRYSNEEIASYMLYDRMLKLRVAEDGKASDGSSFNNQDVAIAWYVDKLKKSLPDKPGSARSNLMDLGVHVNRYLGIAGDTQASSPERVRAEISQTSEKIRKVMAKLDEELKEKVAECFNEEGLYQGSCQFDIQKSLTEFMTNNELVVDQFNNKTIGLIINSAKAPDLPPPPPPAPPKAKVANQPSWSKNTALVTHHQDQQCLVKGFKTETKDHIRISLLGGFAERWKKTMNAISGTVGHASPCHVHAPVPAFEYEQKKKSLCCSSKISWQGEQFLSAGLEAGFKCDIPLVGLGPVVSAGAFIGVDFFLGAEGALEATCSGKGKCIAGIGRVEPQGGVYAQAAADMIRVEGGIRWSPQAKAEQCWGADGHAHPFVVYWQWGKVALSWKIGFFGFDNQGLYSVYEDYKMNKLIEHQIIGSSGSHH